MTQPLVVVIGDVINDIIVRPMGPIADRTDTPSKIERWPGGSGANQAAWLAELNTPVRFVGRVGTPDVAFHQNALEQLGVETRLASSDDRATGTIVVLVAADGERSMFTDRGANSGLGEADLPLSLLEGAGLLHVSGYQLFEPESRAAVRRLWAAATEAGIPTSVDPASVAGLREVGPEPFLEWTSGAELAFPNIDEGRLLSGAQKPDAIVSRLLEHYRIVALKLGASGALVGSADGRRIEIGPRAAQIVDSTGAGDAFCAGFLTSFMRAADLDLCVQDAVSAAARAVCQLGARPRPV